MYNFRCVRHSIWGGVGLTSHKMHEEALEILGAVSKAKEMYYDEFESLGGSIVPCTYELTK